MTDSNLEDLLLKFSKTGVHDGVSFKGRGFKLDNKKDCQEIVDAIEKSPDMTFLDLEGNTLGVEAAQYIGKALGDRPKLSRALWKDMFTGRMKTEIPKALLSLGGGLTKSGAMLTELDLSDNAFGPIGVEALADLLQSRVCFKLQELRLNNNGLGITGGKMLAKALLAGHANSLKEGHALALKVFIAGRNRLENDGATALSSVFKTMGSLEEISMPQNGIYHVGIAKMSEALVHNPSLRVLNLNDNTLTAKGAMSLADALPSLQKLRVINLGDCLLKTRGALILADALMQGHGDLEELVLDSNEIRAPGGLALINASKSKLKMKKLSLQDNEFGNKGRSALRSEAKRLNIENLLDCPSDEDQGDDDEEEDYESDEVSGGDSEESEESTEEEEEDLPILPEEVATVENKYNNTIIGEFLNRPTVANFNRLSEKKVEEILTILQDSKGFVDVPACLRLIMKISSLTATKDEAIQSQSREVAISLYRVLFDWAEKSLSETAVNNALFTYLGLIKDEDNKLKIDWDVDRCVDVLQTADAEIKIPTFTQYILTCCLERKHKKN